LAMIITKFPNKEEADYQAELGVEKVRLARQTNILALILFLVFGILDIWAIPSMLRVAWILRGTIVPLFVLVLFLSKYKNFFVQHYNIIIAFQYFFAGCAIEAMIHLANPTDVAKDVYYAGLILVMMAAYMWTYLPLRITVLLGILMIGIYILVAIWCQQIYASGEWIILMSNCFFLVGANIIGFISQRARDRSSRENFILRKSLRRNLKLVDAAKQRNEFLALHDPLTGLPNRLFLRKHITEMINKLDEQEYTVAVLFIDLDGFKSINDSFGHEIGDAVLHTLSGRLEACIRHGEIAARLGGDEFILALRIPAQNTMKIVQRLAQRVMFSLSQPIIVHDLQFAVSASIGAAIYPYHGRDADTLISIADKQMYRVKRMGKNAVSMADVQTPLFSMVKPDR